MGAVISSAIWRRQRLCEQIALDGIDAEALHALELREIPRPRQHAPYAVAGRLNDTFYDRRGARRLIHVLTEFPVYFDFREWEIVQIGERRKSRAEVVKRHADFLLRDPRAPSAPHAVLDQDGFGDLQIEPARRQPGFRSAHPITVSTISRPRRNCTADRLTATLMSEGPLGGLGAGGGQAPNCRSERSGRSPRRSG